MNIEKTELETTPSETGVKERVRTKDRQGPDRPSEPPPPAPPSEPPAGPDDPKPPRRGGGFLAFLSLLFSLAALALAAWMWWQAQAGESAVEAEAMAEIARLEANDSELSLKIKQVRDEVDSLASDGNVTAEFEAMQRRIRADGEKMAEVEQVMREQMALSRSLQTAAESLQGRLLAAEATVTNLSTRELDAGGELDLAEVDYLLRLANERLKLFSDPEAADQALEVADMHLAALDSPMYLGVRQEIALARQSLDALEMPDYLEISRRMDKLQAAIPELSFIADEAPLEPVADEDEEGWWAKAKSALSSLVTVRRRADTDIQRISLEDKDYVRQRLWLQLEIAHLALMRRDTRAFRESLLRVEETLGAWFDPTKDGFDGVSAEIDALKETAIEARMPDITAPWSMLRTLTNNPPVERPAAPEGPAAGEADTEPSPEPEETSEIEESQG
ncbi:MAG: hypothetical protein HKO85_02215 [Xanthomonadales bacterium]|nr:hypothetical protein [Xanthomonadales bacterium]